MTTQVRGYIPYDRRWTGDMPSPRTTSQKRMQPGLLRSSRTGSSKPNRGARRQSSDSRHYPRPMASSPSTLSRAARHRSQEAFTSARTAATLHSPDSRDSVSIGGRDSPGRQQVRSGCGKCHWTSQRLQQHLKYARGHATRWLDNWSQSKWSPSRRNRLNT